MKLLISSFVLTVAVAAAPLAAAAEQVCMPAPEMKASLIDWYGETPVSAPSENREQLWVSQQTGTWTMIKTKADGHACVVAQGDDWLTGLKQDELVAAVQN